MIIKGVIFKYQKNDHSNGGISMARRNLRNLDERIIKRTIHYGAVNGIENISTKKIANDLRITEPTIYVHFKTKENLLLSAFQKIIQNIYGMPEVKTLTADELVESFIPGFQGILQRARENSEEVIYAFNYRHSQFNKDGPNPLSAAYKLMYSATIKAFSQDEEVCEHINAIVFRLTLEVINTFVYKAAKGEIEPTAVNAKLMAALVYGGLNNGREVFQKSLTPEEMAQLKKICKE